MQKAYIAKTGATDLGLERRADLTGFNWANVPAILVETGFMTNPTEGAKLKTRPLPVEGRARPRERHVSLRRHRLSPRPRRSASGSPRSDSSRFWACRVTTPAIMRRRRFV